MGSQAHILSLLLLWISDSRAETILTQSPAFLSVAAGHKATIHCKASTDIDDDMHWYQQKPGEAPKLIIKGVSTVVSGDPSRFGGSGYGTDFTLTINDVKSEDVAYYFCQHDDNFPYTVIHSVTKTYSVFSVRLSLRLLKMFNRGTSPTVVFASCTSEFTSSFLFCHFYSHFSHTVLNKPDIKAEKDQDGKGDGGSTGDVVMTQTPVSLPHGEPASISCRSSQSLLHRNGHIYLDLFLQKPGQSPQLLISFVSNNASMIPGPHPVEKSTISRALRSNAGHKEPMQRSDSVK
ncbi:uncharacterized protein LOC122116832 [Dipodomys spectabilis]|uniref:uncharacterized protein LOC122116832 n=1 Tax=Dipodomys spectabilis TaxID=105255 RepID=UPI001C541B8C|nr:uncharacterized protein LOC122116832 [Dipodomys spectabilis]